MKTIATSIIVLCSSRSPAAISHNSSAAQHLRESDFGLNPFGFMSRRALSI